MNIGIVTTWFERGAAYVSRMYMNQLEKIFNVFIYARGGENYAKGEKEWDRYNVYWGKRKDVPIASYIYKKDFLKWININKIELILFNEQQWFLPLLWCKERAIKTVAYVDYYTEKTIPFFNMYDFLICNTKRHFEAFESHPDRSYVPWGTDINVFFPKQRDRFTDKLVFFTSAGLNPIRKGTDLLIRAFSKIANDECKLIIHTQVDIEDRIPSVRKILQELIQNNKIIIYKKTVPAPGLFFLGDVYVYPSRLDGIGLTVPEALACGLPVVVPDNPPMNEFIDEHYENGLKVKIRKLYSRDDGYYWPQCETDVDDLAEKMLFFLKNKKDIDKYKKNARNYAVDNLDWAKNAKCLEQIIKGIRFIKPNDEVFKNVIKFEFSRYPYADRIPFIYTLYSKINRIGKFLFYFLKH